MEGATELGEHAGTREQATKAGHSHCSAAPSGKKLRDWNLKLEHSEVALAQEQHCSHQAPKLGGTG